MKRLFGSVIDIRRGELVVTLLMVMVYYLILMTYYFLKPARDSLFLVKVDPTQLPVVFIITALVTVPVVSLYARAGRQMKLNRLMTITTAVLIVNLAVLWWLVRLSSAWVYYLFYVWVSIYGALTTSQFWLLANAVFDPAQAKRLFVLLGLGGIVGAFTGGEITNLLVSRLGVATPNLLAFCMVILLVTALLVNYVWRIARVEEHALTRVVRYKPREKETLARSFVVIKRSRHLLLMVGLVAVTMLVSSFIDYQFKVISRQTYTTTATLTAFLGKFYGRLSLISLVLQLFFAYRFLRILGVGGVILFLPLGLLFGSVAMLIVPGIVAAMLVRGADGALEYSFDKIGRELLILPVPLQIKKQVKIFLDLFVDRWFRGVAGGLLLLCTLIMHLSIRQISAVVIAFILVWIGLALFVRKEYLNSFRRALERREIDPSELRTAITDSAALSALRASLKSDNERQITYALEMLATVNDRALEGDLLPLVSHSSADIRALAIEALHESGSNKGIEEISRRVSDPDPEVRLQAVRYLVDRTPGAGNVILEQYLSDKDVAVQSAALAYIALFGSDRQKAAVETRFVEQLLDRAAESDPDCRAQIAGVLGDIGGGRFTAQIMALAKDKNAQVANNAILAMGRARDRQFVSWLVTTLADRRHRSFARTALASYGVSILGTLGDYLHDSKTVPDIRRRIPGVLAKIPAQKTVNILAGALDRVDPQYKFFVVKALNKLRANRPELHFPEERLLGVLIDEARLYYETSLILHHCHSSDRDEACALLKKTLRQKLDGNLERIFRLLGLSYPPADIFNAYRGITSRLRSQRASAVEFLDNLLRHNVKKFVLPIVDDAPRDIVFQRGRELFGLTIKNPTDALKALIRGRDPWLSACAIYAARFNLNAALIDTIAEQENHADPVVSETARKVLCEIQERIPKSDIN